MLKIKKRERLSSIFLKLLLREGKIVLAKFMVVVVHVLAETWINIGLTGE
ncbi:hypothetical protein [Neobacillus citreus]|nr:hypothetical protein [Neobacillus citreus]